MSYSQLQNSQTNNNVKILYLDVNLFYGLNDNRLLVSNTDDLENQLIFLLFTEPGEVEFEPTLGSLTQEVIFSNPGQVMNWILENKVFEAVVEWLGNVINLNLSKSFIEVGANEQGEAYMRLVWNAPVVNNVPQTTEVRFNS